VHHHARDASKLVNVQSGPHFHQSAEDAGSRRPTAVPPIARTNGIAPKGFLAVVQHNVHAATPSRGAGGHSCARRDGADAISPPNAHVVPANQLPQQGVKDALGDPPGTIRHRKHPARLQGECMEAGEGRGGLAVVPGDHSEDVQQGQHELIVESV